MSWTANAIAIGIYDIGISKTSNQWERNKKIIRIKAFLIKNITYVIMLNKTFCYARVPEVCVYIAYVILELKLHWK